MKKRPTLTRTISTRLTPFDEISPIFVGPYATALIRTAAEEYRITGDHTFTGFLDGDGQHLIFEVHYDPDYWLTGDDESPEAYAAREWVHLHVRDPQFNLSLLEIWVDLSNRRVNIDDETASEEARYGSVATKASQIDDYLNDILLPAIRARIAKGRNPLPPQRNSVGSDRMGAQS
jgi:hypothetical protein